MEAFKGKYERVSAEKYEEFLKVVNEATALFTNIYDTKALDVSYLLRKAATVSTPTMDVTEENGVWTIKTSTTLKSMELKFKVSLR